MEEDEGQIYVYMYGLRRTGWDGEMGCGVWKGVALGRGGSGRGVRVGAGQGRAYNRDHFHHFHRTSQHGQQRSKLEQVGKAWGCECQGKEVCGVHVW